MLQQQKSLFRVFLSLLSRHNESPSFLSSSPTVKQTSIALIFRLDPKLIRFENTKKNDFPDKKGFFREKRPENQAFPFQSAIKGLQDYLNSLEFIENETNSNLFEFLLIKRSNSEKDRHKGQIAFPGGKCEPGETDFQAVKREVREEVGLDLDSKDFLALGKTPLNTWAYYHQPGVSTYISMYVFFKVAGEEQQQTFMPNEEVQKAFWQTFSGFIYGGRNSLKKEIDFTPGQNYYCKNRMLFLLFRRFFMDMMQARMYRVFLLDNGEKMYGLSLNMMVYVLRLIEKEAGKLEEGLESERKELRRIVARAFEVSFEVRRNWLPGRSFIKGRFMGWVFYRNRIRQFLAE